MALSTIGFTTSVVPFRAIKFQSLQCVSTSTRRKARVPVCSIGPPDESEREEHAPEDDASWTFLTERLSRLREKEVARDRKLAQNWQTGLYTQTIVASLNNDYIRRVSFSDDILAYGSISGSVVVSHMNTGKSVQNSNVHVGQITALHCAGAHTVSAAATDFSVAVWNTAPLQSPRFWTSCADNERNALLSHPKFLIEEHSAIVTDVIIDTAANRLYTSCVDGFIRVYDLDSGELELDINIGEPIFALILTDKKYLLCGCKSGNVYAYEAERGLFLLSIPCHGANTTALDFFEESQILVTGDASGAIRVWSLHDAIRLGDIPGHSAAVMSIQVDHSKVVTSGRDGCINVSMLGSMQRAYSIPGYTPYITSAYFDDRRLISDGSNDVIVCNYFDVDMEADTQGETLLY